jgi:hypothetical protein
MPTTPALSHILKVLSFVPVFLMFMNDVPARLDMATLAPVSDVDHNSHLVTQSGPPHVNRDPVHDAHVRVTVCGPVFGTQQTT